MSKYLVGRVSASDSSNFRPMDLKNLSQKLCNVLDKPGPKIQYPQRL